MSEPTIHPNLARIAAAYDQILAQMDHRQISPAVARAQIAQLEARDDEGIRWTIDPDTGEWMRTTALGDSQYDQAPPTSGYMTSDAFDYSHASTAFNPSSMMIMTPVDAQLTTAPTSLLGATRAATGPLPRAAGILDKISATSTRVQVIGATLIVLVLALIIHAVSGTPANKESPTPTATVATHAPASPSPTVHH